MPAWALSTSGVRFARMESVTLTPGSPKHWRTSPALGASATLYSWISSPS